MVDFSRMVSSSSSSLMATIVISLTMIAATLGKVTIPEFNPTDHPAETGFQMTPINVVRKTRNQFMNKIFMEVVEKGDRAASTQYSTVTFKMNENNQKMVLVDVWAKTDTLEEDLKNLGDDVFETVACYKKMGCSGLVVVREWIKVQRLLSVRSIHPFLAKGSGLKKNNKERHLGLLDGNGQGSISGARTPLLISKIIFEHPELTGKGMKVGILSDSFNLLQGYPLDIQSGDLPDDVDIIQDYLPNLGSVIDEGRAMLQLVHDLVPDAKLAFHTALIGSFGFARGIEKLADAGCDVIADDILLFNDPWYQPNPAGIAATEVVEERGIPYLSSIANNFGEVYSAGPYVEGDSCYTSPVDGLPAESCHVFTNGSTKQRVFLNNPQGSCSFILQWDQPWGNSESDVDAALLDPVSGDVVWLYNSQNVGGDPIENDALPLGTGQLDLVISLSEGPAPNYMKYWATDCFSFANPPLNDSSVSTQAILKKTAGVGAASEIQVFGSLVMESYSSAGGQPIVFDADGNRLPEPQVNKKPNFTGPDQTANTFFPPPYNSKNVPDPVVQTPNRFGGTSAAAPNVAAVATLMQQAGPDLTPKDIFKILEDTSIDMNSKGYDIYSGMGFINGYLAVEGAVQAQAELDATPSPTTSPTKSPTPKPSPFPTTMPSSQPTTRKFAKKKKFIKNAPKKRGRTLYGSGNYYSQKKFTITRRLDASGLFRYASFDLDFTTEQEYAFCIFTYYE